MSSSPGLVGRLLVAAPMLTDPNFRRTVVLMLDHGDHGATGLVLNRPLQVEVAAVLPGWQSFLTDPAVLFQGGPVGLDSALGVVGVPGDGIEPPGVRRVVGSLGLVDLDTPPETVAGGVTGVRIFAGHSGWESGQLEQELDEGAWFLVDGESRDAFTPRPGELWRDVLRRQRGALAYLSSYPEDPSSN